MKNIKTNRIDKEKLIECYKKNGNAVKMGLEFGVSNSTVLKIVRSHNISVIGEYKKYTDDYIISKYRELGTAEKTGDYLGIGDERVRDVLDRNNIDRTTLKHISIGDVYGKLTVMEFVGHHVTTGGGTNKIFLCRCECGCTKKVKSSRLTRLQKSVNDCGCGFKKLQEERELKRKEKEGSKQLWLDKMEEYRLLRIERELNKKPPTERKYKVGYKHHRLTILSEVGVGDNKVFTVECECGTIKDIRRLTITNTKSCGCLQRERQREGSTVHGLSKKTNPERIKWYDRWRSVVKRCYNDKNIRYMDYGGRGIRVCDRWLEPNGVGCDNYYNDIHTILGPQPGSNYSLDRIDNDGMYEITNLQWATISEQNKNRRRYIKG